MIKKVLLATLFFSWIPAQATEPQDSPFRPDGSIVLPGCRSLTAGDAVLWGQMMANRAALPPAEQAIFSSGTHGFHFARTMERMAAGIRYHCMAFTPEGQEPGIQNTMFASIGVFPRHGYNERLYPQIIASLTQLSVVKDETPGIATFAIFMDPSMTSDALKKNQKNLFSLVAQLSHVGEKLPEERSAGSADVKIRAVPSYLIVLLHPQHPFSLAMGTSRFSPLKDATRKDSHALDLYIDGPVNAAIMAIAKTRTGIETDKEAREALKSAIASGTIAVDHLKPEIEAFFAAQGHTLPWRSTFVLALKPEAVEPLEALATMIASNTEYTEAGLSRIAIDVAMEKLTSATEY